LESALNLLQNQAKKNKCQKVNSQKLGADPKSYKVMKYPNILKKAVDCVKRKKRAFKKIVLLRKKILSS